MTKSYFSLYKQANKLVFDKKIVLENIKTTEEGDTYYFKSNEHQVTLKVTKIPNTRLWLRHWSCDCEHFSLWQDKAECKHIISCILYLTIK
jgi:YHS domain-containing protein